MVKVNFFNAKRSNAQELSQSRREAVAEAGFMDLEDEVAMETLNELELLFNYLDFDNEGTISADELGHVMDILEIKYENDDLDYMLKELDIDNSGDIDFVEFVAFMTSTATPPYSQEEVMKAFKLFEDKSHRGYVSKGTLIDALCIYSENPENRCKLQDAKELVGQMEVNPDGLVDYKNFVEGVMKL